MVKSRIKTILSKRSVRSVIDRLDSFTLTRDQIIRIRFVLFLTALLALFLAFQVGDDWYVREFANYDWARHIGY